MVRRIGVDIGGTGVRAGLVGEDGRIHGEVVRGMLADRSIARVVDAVAEVVHRLGGADHIGIGVPGFVREGRVIASPNFPEWSDTPIGALVAGRCGAPVAVENDASAAAFGAWLARGRVHDLVLLTLGTGVGGGVVAGGRLLRGAGGTGGELGHIFVGGMARCGCGGIGCLETWCSDVGFSRIALEQGHAVRGAADVVRAADEGSAWASACCERVAEHLGRGLVTLINIFNPDVVVISGGLTAARHRLAPRAEAWVQAHGIRANVDWVRIEWEGRADAYAIAGAALAAAR